MSDLRGDCLGFISQKIEKSFSRDLLEIGGDKVPNFTVFLVVGLGQLESAKFGQVLTVERSFKSCRALNEF